MTLIGSVLTGMQSTLTGAEYRPPKSVMEQYVEHLGRLSANLHSLELWLRAFLFTAEGHAKPGVDLRTVKVGDTFLENAMTDYASLGELIKRYNKLADSKIAVSKDDIVSLRDSLAHGRVHSNTWQPPFKLVTFAKPKDGKVTVTSVENLDAAWLEAKRKMIEDAIKKVGTAVAMLMLEPSK